MGRSVVPTVSNEEGTPVPREEEVVAKGDVVGETSSRRLYEIPDSGEAGRWPNGNVLEILAARALSAL